MLWAINPDLYLRKVIANCNLPVNKRPPVPTKYLTGIHQFQRWRLLTLTCQQSHHQLLQRYNNHRLLAASRSCTRPLQYATRRWDPSKTLASPVLRPPSAVSNCNYMTSIDRRRQCSSTAAECTPTSITPHQPSQRGR